MFALLICGACGKNNASWSRNSLHYKDASLELPGALRPSTVPTPKDSHPFYKDGYAFHGNFGKVDVYIMDAKLLKTGAPSPLETSKMLLKGFGDKHGMTIGKASPYVSLAGGDGIQLVTSAKKGSEEFGVSVHSVNKGKRQVNVRIVWPKNDKKSLDDAYRISNSLKIR